MMTSLDGGRARSGVAAFDGAIPHRRFETRSPSEDFSMPLNLPTMADVAASRTGKLKKHLPRVLSRIEQKLKLAKTERACRKAVDARDGRRCFWPTCRTFATDKHHIQARSLGGTWQTHNILSACSEHHAYFKAGLIRVRGNPDRGPVRVWVTALGTESGLVVPKGA